MNLTVLGPRVFIRPDKLPGVTESGLLYVVHEQSESTITGTVVAVGEGPEFIQRAVTGALNALSQVFRESGSERAEARTLQALYEFQSEHLVAVGDHVLFSPDRGQELVFDKDLLICLAEDDILAVIEQEHE
jgi:co-chaperonin GroES (HSP10)